MSEKTIVKRKFSTKQVTTVGMLFGITIVLGATGLGFIPVPPFKLTIMHIPVIIGSLLEGPIVGGILGLMFGGFSMFQAINTPLPTSFIFLNPIVSVIPRIFIGITPYLAYKYIKIKNQKIKLGLCSAIGSFTNTIGVVGMIYILYLDKYAQVLNISIATAKKTLFALILNGFNSATVSILFALPIILAVKKIRKM